jgi:oligopeptide transport system substrate-binding protein
MILADQCTEGLLLREHFDIPFGNRDLNSSRTVTNVPHPPAGSFFMQIPVSYLSYLLFFCTSLFIATSCTKKEEPTKDIHLYFQTEPFSLDPRMGGDRRSQAVIRPLFEGLYRIGKDGSPQPGLAESVSLSKDQTVYTFHLRPSLWSNGLPVTALDFEWAWKSAIDPAFPTPFCYIYFVIKNAKRAHLNECSIDEVGIRALDDKTLEVTLEHPTPYFLELTTAPLYSPLSVSAITQTTNWAGTEYPAYVSNGPFILKKHAFKSEFILEKNPLYWDKEHVSSQRISFAIIEDPHTAFTLFEKGELDWYGDPCGIIPLDIIHSFGDALIKQNVGGLYWIVACTEKPYLASPKIRRAIATALNRKELISFINGGEEPAYSILPTFLTMLEEPTFKDCDPQEAKQLFEEGCSELGLTPSTYPTLTLTHWSEPTTKALAEIAQQQLQNALGIKIELRATDWATYMKKVPAGEIDLAMASWTTWIKDPMFNLEYLKFKKNGINGTLWQNAEYIAELNAADSSTDPTERRAHMAKAEQIAMNELPLIPLYYLAYKYIKQPAVHGEVISPVGAVELKWIEKE